MEIKDMNMAEVEERLNALELEVREMTDVEAVEKATEEKKSLLERKAELKAHEERMAQAEAIQNNNVEVVVKEERKEVKKMGFIEERANKLVETGKMSLETRQLLAAGVLSPEAVKNTIGELPEVISSIVDDVNVIMVDGVGSYAFAYTATGATAAKVTDGSTIGGTGAGFKDGSISPETWGVLDSISRLVSKTTPLAYEQAMRNKMYVALRKYAKDKIITAILADHSLSSSKRMTEDATYALDQDFVRSLVLGFNADEAVAGGTKLYLCKADLATLGKVRGTNEKKAIFEITFTDENNGVIKDGGLAVNFSICENLAGQGASSGNAMIYGQPKTITMPLWGNYEISTDESGHYFDKNLIGLRGLQTAGVGITSLKGIQLINM